MDSRTQEAALEAGFEHDLLGRGWTRGDRGEWDRDLALFPARLLEFVRATQPNLLGELEGAFGAETEGLLAEAAAKDLNRKGTLHVLRHGFRFQGKTVRAAQFKPAHDLAPEIAAAYAANTLTVTRQVLCHRRGAETVDVALALNGLPFATAEVKNPQTGQTWEDAVKQYRDDRDPAAPLFRFKSRAVVHFVVDPQQVWMTTKLEGPDTRFLPFNRGSDPGRKGCGAGNPAHPSGVRTAYLWEDVLARDSAMDILGRFMFVQRTERKVYEANGKARRVKREAVIFPRYHQLDAVRTLAARAREEGPGEAYLVQHSAGSGKTNSIAWLAHRLASLHTDDGEPAFHCVLVVTDRTVLDSQLQDAVYQIEHAQGVVKAIDDDSGQLADALVDGTKVVVSTVQKFPFVLRRLLKKAGADDPDAATAAERGRTEAWRAKIAARRYAVIVDEAHSGQTGETAREMKELLGAAPPAEGDERDGDGPDWEDGMNRVMDSRRRPPNVSFFSFTATPKGKTLELFGRVGPSGKPEPAHLYTMRQAIEEDFIRDVLKQYTTYKTFWSLAKRVADDPKFPKKKAARALAKFAVLHPTNVRQKVEIIVEHFRQTVRPHLKGRAKAMVVASSRLHAVRYKLAFDEYLAEKGHADVRTLAAFSGTVHDPETGRDYTEAGMNVDVADGRPIPESALPDRFASPDYNVLVVADKYQTGFDEPQLLAMYVDRRLGDVRAVQTLSRLNRAAPGKDSPFVLDFVNEADHIRQAFEPYYEVTRLDAESDPDQLETLRHELDTAQVYHAAEVEGFAREFYGKSSRRGRAFRRGGGPAAMDDPLRRPVPRPAR